LPCVGNESCPSHAAWSIIKLTESQNVGPFREGTIED
jgi:hypothetical protein